jgi:hypothetical protein
MAGALPNLTIPSWCNGSTDSLEAAKDEFKAAWERFYASLTPEARNGNSPVRLSSLNRHGA